MSSQDIHPVSSCVKPVRLVMLINFCLLHLQYLGSLCWLGATAASERATSSLSGAGGNSLHTSNWTKCLSNSESSYTDQIIIRTRCQQKFLALLAADHFHLAFCLKKESSTPLWPRRNLARGEMEMIASAIADGARVVLEPFKALCEV